MVSGRSGSGKSTALHTLEDLDYYCIDNLPVSLLPAVAKKMSQEATAKVAVGIDARNMPQELDNFSALIKDIPDSVDLHIIYLDAKDETLIKRFAETRRKHPLSSDLTSLPEALTNEKTRLEDITAQAHLNIDTTDMNLHDLREFIRARIGESEKSIVSIMFQSFGYKNNVPIDSDLVFDVRCLPNPHWQPELRPFNGNDKPIIDFLGASKDADSMLEDIIQFLEKWLPKYEATDRRYITVSIGCTGGHHRSVYVANCLQQHFSSQYADVKTRHRQLLN